MDNAADPRPWVHVTAQPHEHICVRSGAHHPRLDLFSAAPRGPFLRVVEAGALFPAPPPGATAAPL